VARSTPAGVRLAAFVVGGTKKSTLKLIHKSEILTEKQSFIKGSSTPYVIVLQALTRKERALAHEDDMSEIRDFRA
jgi:hypothetical protein